MHIYLLCSLYNTIYNTFLFLFSIYCAFSIILNAQYLVFLVISDSSVHDYNVVQFGWHSRSLWCQFRKTCMYLYFCDTVVVCAKLQENNITVFHYKSNTEGSVLNISCLEGYSLPEGEVKSVCGSDGSWSPDPNNYECTLSSMYIWLTIIHTMHESTYLPLFNSIYLYTCIYSLCTIMYIKYIYNYRHISMLQDCVVRRW